MKSSTADAPESHRTDRSASASIARHCQPTSKKSPWPKARDRAGRWQMIQLHISVAGSSGHLPEHRRDHTAGTNSFFARQANGLTALTGLPAQESLGSRQINLTGQSQGAAYLLGPSASDTRASRQTERRSLARRGELTPLSRPSSSQRLDRHSPPAFDKLQKLRITDEEERLA